MKYPWKNDNRGFTLVELLIVVALIAVLAAIAMPAYYKFINKARETEALTYLKDIHRAEMAYMVSMQIYSGSFDDLEVTNLISIGDGSTVRDYGGYRYTLILTGVNAWNVVASPIFEDSAEMKWFWVDETGVIRYVIGAAPTSASPPI